MSFRVLSILFALSLFMGWGNRAPQIPSPNALPESPSDLQNGPASLEGESIGFEVREWDPELHASFSCDPPELQLGCCRACNGGEEAIAAKLAKADPAARLSAAQKLWRGQSRSYAREVIQFVSMDVSSSDEFTSFRQEVENSIRPQTVLQELRGGNYRWGVWLAFLRPHKDLVPALLDGLKDEPEDLSATILALGNSGDRRALEPLLEFLKSDDYWKSGEAARALGSLGDSDAEPKLIEALSRDKVWARAQVCEALGKTGTRRALPALEKLANDNRYTGAVNLKETASWAMEQIVKRNKRCE